MNNRNLAIVNLRVLAILAVVIGHCIIIYDPAWYTWVGYKNSYSSSFIVCIKQIINLFQMELFFSISGFCMYYSIHKLFDFKKFVINKAKRLIIPYVFIGLLWQLPLRYIAKFPEYSGKDLSHILFDFAVFRDNGYLWFLPVLFGLFILAYFLIKSSRYSLYYIPAVVIILFIVSHFIPNTLQMATIAKYSLYFFLGFYVNHINLLQWPGIRKIAGAAICAGISVILLILSKIGTISFVEGGGYLYKGFLSVCIVLILYLLVPRNSGRIVSGIDRDSFGIYLFHMPVLYLGYCYFGDMPPYFFVPVQLLLCISVSLFMIKLLRYFNLHFVIGESSK